LADPWYRDLKIEHKLLWNYLLDNCDNAGIWIVNTKLADFQINHKFDWDEVTYIFNDRFTQFDGGRKWLITKFIEFQYVKLNENSNPHKAVIKTLKKHGLYELVQGYLGSLKDKEQDKEQLQDKDKEEEKEEDTNHISTKDRDEFIRVMPRS